MNHMFPLRNPSFLAYKVGRTLELFLYKYKTRLTLCTLLEEKTLLDYEQTHSLLVVMQFHQLFFYH